MEGEAAIRALTREESSKKSAAFCHVHRQDRKHFDDSRVVHST